jgi:hypothetical protein
LYSLVSKSLHPLVAKDFTQPFFIFIQAFSTLTSPRRTNMDIESDESSSNHEELRPAPLVNKKTPSRILYDKDKESTSSLGYKINNALSFNSERSTATMESRDAQNIDTLNYNNPLSTKAKSSDTLRQINATSTTSPNSSKGLVSNPLPLNVVVKPYGEEHPDFYSSVTSTIETRISSTTENEPSLQLLRSLKRKPFPERFCSICKIPHPKAMQCWEVGNLSASAVDPWPESVIDSEENEERGLVLARNSVLRGGEGRIEAAIRKREDISARWLEMEKSGTILEAQRKELGLLVKHPLLRKKTFPRLEHWMSQELSLWDEANEHVKKARAKQLLAITQNSQAKELKASVPCDPTKCVPGISAAATRKRTNTDLYELLLDVSRSGLRETEGSLMQETRKLESKSLCVASGKIEVNTAPRKASQNYSRFQKACEILPAASWGYGASQAPTNLEDVRSQILRQKPSDAASKNRKFEVSLSLEVVGKSCDYLLLDGEIHKFWPKELTIFKREKPVGNQQRFNECKRLLQEYFSGMRAPTAEQLAIRSSLSNSLSNPASNELTIQKSKPTMWRTNSTTQKTEPALLRINSTLQPSGFTIFTTDTGSSHLPQTPRDKQPDFATNNRIYENDIIERRLGPENTVLRLPRMAGDRNAEKDKMKPGTPLMDIGQAFAAHEALVSCQAIDARAPLAVPRAPVAEQYPATAKQSRVEAKAPLVREAPVAKQDSGAEEAPGSQVSTTTPDERAAARTQAEQGRTILLEFYYCEQQEEGGFHGNDENMRHPSQMHLTPDIEFPLDYFMKGVSMERQRHFELAHRSLHGKVVFFNGVQDQEAYNDWKRAHRHVIGDIDIPDRLIA